MTASATSLLFGGILTAFAYCYFTAEWNRYDDVGGITLGICLLLLAIVVRYGAELEQKNKGK